MMGIGAASSATSQAPAQSAVQMAVVEINGRTITAARSCQMWESFFVQLSGRQGRFEEPVSLAMATQTGPYVDITTVTCTNETHAWEIAHSLLHPQYSAISVACDGRVWYASKCPYGVALSICPSEAACAALDPCGSDARAPNVMSPCSEADDDYWGLRVLSVGMYERGRMPPPVLASHALVAKHEAWGEVFVLSTTFSNSTVDGGQVYCDAFPTGSVGPTSETELLLGNMASVHDHAAEVPMPRLLLASDYDVYCLSSAADGTKTTLEEVLATRMAVRTPGVLKVRLELRSSTFIIGEDAFEGALAILVDRAPAADLSIEIAARAVDDGSESSAFRPGRLSLQSASSTDAASAFYGHDAMSAGDYEVQVTLSGSDADAYEVEFVGGRHAFRLFGDEVYPDPPQAMRATFTPDGTTVTLVLDRPSDRSRLPSGSFVCANMFEFSGSGNSQCDWTSDSVVRIKPGADDSGAYLSVGDVVVVSEAVAVRYKCAPDSDCDEYAISVPALLYAEVGAPSAPMIPQPSIAAPETLPACANLLLDFSGSRGSSGRAWRSVTLDASVNEADPAATADMQNFVASADLTAGVEIPADLLQGGKKHSFVLEVCNFLGVCGTTRHLVLVQGEDTIGAPTVRVHGQQIRIIKAADSFELSASADVPSCEGGETSIKGLHFWWSVYEGALQRSDLQSSSKDSSIFRLPAYALKAGSTFTVSVMASIASSRLSSQTTVQIVVENGPVVASIVGNAEVNVRVGETLVIDAGGSRDSDVLDVSGSAAGLSYEWSCQQVEPAVPEGSSTSCPGLVLPDSLFHELLVVEHAQVSTQSIVTVRAVHQSTGRSSEASVRVFTRGSTHPMVTLTQESIDLKKVRLNPCRRLNVAGSIEVDAPGTATWVIDPPVDSSMMALPAESVIGAPTEPYTFSSYLGLVANALPESSHFTFTLHIQYNDGRHGSASVAVVTNGPPVPGALGVSPSTGVEFATSFEMKARNWEDDDLPLSYAFGILVARNEGSQMSVLRSRSESSMSRHYLSAGTEGDAFAVHVVMQVFDAMDMVSRASAAITVNPLSRPSRRRLTDSGGEEEEEESRLSIIRTFAGATIYNSNISEMNSMEASELRSNAAVVTGAMNSQICTLPTDIASCGVDLHRADCRRTPGTCGACLSRYTGESADANSRCVAVADAAEREVLAWEHKRCPGDCSGSVAGTCMTRDEREAAVSAAECRIGDPCEAVCVCNTGFAGLACELSLEDADAKNALRTVIIRTTADMDARFSDAIFTEVERRAAGLLASLGSPSEVGSDVVITVLSTAVELLESVRGMASMDVAVAESLMESVDAALVHADMFSSGSEDPLPLVLRALELLGPLLSRDLLPSETSRALTRRYMKQQTYMLSSHDADVPDGRLVLPSDGMYDVPSEVSLSLGSREDIQVSLVTVNRATAAKMSGSQSTAGPAAMSAPQLISDVVIMDVIGADRALDCSRTDVLREAIFVIQTATARSLSPLFPYNTTQFFSRDCFQGTVSYETVDCFGQQRDLPCDGTYTGTVNVKCTNTMQATCSVNALSGGAGGADAVCRVVARDETTTTCACDVCAAALAGGGSGSRRLSASSSVSVVEVAAMSDYVLSDFVTVSANLDMAWSASTYEMTLNVVKLFGSLWLLTALLLLWSELNQDAVRGLSKDEKVRMERRKSSIAPMDMDETDEQKGKRMLDYIDSLFPTVFSMESSKKRMMREASNQHLLLKAFTSHTREERMLHAYEFLTLVNLTLLMVAFVTSLEVAEDDGSCATFHTKEICLTDVMMFNADEHECAWDGVQCTWTPPKSFQLSVLVAVLCMSIALTVPLRLMLTFLFDKVLHAPTATAYQKMQKSSDRRKGSVVPMRLAKKMSRMVGLGGAKNKDSGGGWFGIGRKNSIVGDSLQHNFSKMVMVPDATLQHRLQVSAFIKSNFNTSADGRSIRQLAGRKRMDTVLMATNTEDDGTRRGSNTGPGSEDDEGHCLMAMTPENLFLELHLNVQEKIRTDGEVGIAPCKAFLKQWDLALVGKDNTIIWNARRELVDRLDHVLYVAQSRIGDLKRLPGAGAGVELFRNFIVDMLGRETYVGKCFDYKSESYFRLARVITWELKTLAVAVTILFNYWCFTTCVVYGALKGQVWMENWTLLSCFCLFFLVTVDMSVEAIMVGYILPTQIMPNVRLAQVMIKRSMAAQTKSALAKRNSDTKDAVRFSASDYVFVSTLMAREMLHLPEANLVLGYSDPLPHAANAVKRSAGLCPSTTDVIELLLARVSLPSLLLYIASFPVFAQRAIVTAPMPIIGSFATGACIMAVTYGKKYPMPFFISIAFLSGALISWGVKMISSYRQNDTVGEGDDFEIVNGKTSKVDYSDMGITAVDDHFQKLLAMKVRMSVQRGSAGTHRGTHVASVMAKAPTSLAPAPRRASVSVQVKPWHAPEEEDNASPSSSSDNEDHDVISDGEVEVYMQVLAMEQRLLEIVDPVSAAAATALPSAVEKRATLRRKSTVMFHMEQDAEAAEVVLLDVMKARRRQSVARLEERLANRLNISDPVPVVAAAAVHGNSSDSASGEDGEDGAQAQADEERNRVVLITRKRVARRLSRAVSECNDVLDLFTSDASSSTLKAEAQKSVLGHEANDDCSDVDVNVTISAKEPKKYKRKKTKKKKVFSKPLSLGTNDKVSITGLTLPKSKSAAAASGKTKASRVGGKTKKSKKNSRKKKKSVVRDDR